MKYALLVLALSLGGCAAPAPPLSREKPGATEQEFMADRYACLQQSATTVYGSYAGPYGGASKAQTGCDYQLYDACMNARGYALVQSGRFSAPVYCVQ